MKIGVAIASRRRPDDIANILPLLAQQSLPPHRILLSVTSPADLPPGGTDEVEVVQGSAGLCAQRNRALEAFSDCDIILFYDDDFIPSRHALAGLAELFRANPQIVGATGLVLQDGVKTGGVSLPDALEIVRSFDEGEPQPPQIKDVPSTYGCNMAFRLSAVGAMRFDERLAMYGWQEDVDFSARMRKAGAVVKTNCFAGVHLGVPGGRSPGRALGYSQMVNPAYLVGKGTMPRIEAMRLMTRNLIANHLRALFPEPHIDRAGRASGNWAGLRDILQRRGRPEKILGF